MASFFVTPASQRKRKWQDTTSFTQPSKRNGRPHVSASRHSASTKTDTNRKPTKVVKRTPEDDDSISGSGSDLDSDLAPETDLTASDSEYDSHEETAAERRLKLAERYLENVRTEVQDGREIGFDAKDVDRDLIASRLKQDVDEEQGKMYRQIADSLNYREAEKTFFRADTLATTGVAVCPPFIYTVSKDSFLIKWQISAPLHYKTHPVDVTGTKSVPVRRKPKQLRFVNCKRSQRPTSEQPFKELHTAAILCVAASVSGKFVVTGGADKKLIIWDASTLSPLKVFTQHRDSVTSLAFRGKTHQLFSGSKDRTIKVWSLDELAYVETLFGHLDEVVDIAAVGGTQERCVSVGARDRSARLWKVVEQSQLVFRGGGQSSIGSGDRKKNQEHTTVASVNGQIIAGLSGSNYNANMLATPKPNVPKFLENSLDRVIQPATNLFVTGSDSGALCLYALHRKKALEIIPLAHGFDDPPDLSIWSAEENPSDQKIAALMKHGPQPSPRWITALACLPGSDLFVSGSWDGCVRIWRITEDQRRIEPVAVLGSPGPSTSSPRTRPDMATDEGTAIPVGPFKGVINDLAVFERGERGKEGITIVLAVGSEPRLGRWLLKEKKQPGVKNGAFVIDVPRQVLVNGHNLNTSDKF